MLQFWDSSKYSEMLEQKVLQQLWDNFKYSQIHEQKLLQFWDFFTTVL
jgi:hypothetical protein